MDEFAAPERKAILIEYKNGQMSLEDFINGFANLPSNLKMQGFGNQEELKELALQMLLPDLLVCAAYMKGIDKGKSFKNKLLELKETQMALKLREEFILDTVEVTPQEVREFYENNKKIYTLPAQTHIKEIMLGSKKEAGDILKKVKSGADFSKIAQEKTLRTDVGKKGGDLGYIQESQYPKLFEAAFKLRKNQVSEPIKLSDPRFGEVYSIIKLIDKKSKEVKNFSEVKEDARLKVMWEKRNKVMKSWTEKAKEKIKVELNEKVLGMPGKDSTQTESQI